MTPVLVLIVAVVLVCSVIVDHDPTYQLRALNGHGGGVTGAAVAIGLFGGLLGFALLVLSWFVG